MQERFTPFARTDLDARQQKIFDDIASGPRGTVPWIFHLFLNSPELASRVQQLGAFCRYGTGLPPRLSELAILIAAHHWEAEYEWSIHAGEARKAGLSGDVIVAIAEGRRPVFGDRGGSDPPSNSAPCARTRHDDDGDGWSGRAQNHFCAEHRDAGRRCLHPLVLVG